MEKLAAGCLGRGRTAGEHVHMLPAAAAAVCCLISVLCCPPSARSRRPMQGLIHARGFDLADEHKCLLVSLEDCTPEQLPAGHAPLPPEYHKRKTVNFLHGSCLRLRQAQLQTTSETMPSSNAPPTAARICFWGRNTHRRAAPEHVCCMQTLHRPVGHPIDLVSPQSACASRPARLCAGPCLPRLTAPPVPRAPCCCTWTPTYPSSPPSCSTLCWACWRRECAPRLLVKSAPAGAHASWPWFSGRAPLRRCMRCWLPHPALARWARALVPTSSCTLHHNPPVWKPPPSLPAAPHICPPAATFTSRWCTCLTTALQTLPGVRSQIQHWLAVFAPSCQYDACV